MGRYSDGAVGLLESVVTIEVMTAEESVLTSERFETTTEGFDSRIAHVAAWPNLVWTIEGCEGIGRHSAARLAAIGEPVVDVPAKYSARARAFATGLVVSHSRFECTIHSRW